MRGKSDDHGKKESDQPWFHCDPMGNHPLLNRPQRPSLTLSDSPSLTHTPSQLSPSLYSLYLFTSYIYCLPPSTATPRSLPPELI
jgi:hypothetical protein